MVVKPIAKTGPALVITHVCAQTYAGMVQVLVITYGCVKPVAEMGLALVITHRCAQTYVEAVPSLGFAYACVITSA